MTSELCSICNEKPANGTIRTGPGIEVPICDDCRKKANETVKVPQPPLPPTRRG
jgi:hypothetical protein